MSDTDAIENEIARILRSPKQLRALAEDGASAVFRIVPGLGVEQVATGGRGDERVRAYPNLP